jgi:hypothetical protein
MDFIERFLGFSPDGGSGATESMFFLVPLALFVLVVFRRSRRGT